MRRWTWLAGGALTLAAIVAATWWQRQRSVEAELLAAEPYRILERHERDDYRFVLEAWREFKSGKRDRAAFVRDANARYSQAATRRLGSASDAAVRALIEDTVRTARKLRERSPEACFRYFHPEVTGAPDIDGILSAEEQRRTLELMGDVVRSAAEEPVARPSQEDVADPLADVINSIYERFGTDAQMVAHPEDPRIDRGKVCEITTSLYERILALPPAVSVQVIRFMAPQSGAPARHEDSH